MNTNIDDGHKTRCNGSVPEECIDGHPVTWRPCPICNPVASAEYDSPSATGSTPAASAGTGPDPRIPGLEFAADIADHWHQRFMTLAIELPDTAKASAVNALGFKAVGAKQVLDEIRAECARLALAAEREARDAGRDGEKL